MNWRVCPTHYSISIFAFLWLLYLHLNFCLYLNLCTCICILVVEGCMTWRALTVCSTVHGSLLRQWCVSTQPVLETLQIYINHNSRTGCRPVNQLCNSALCGADTVWMTYWRLTCRANASLKFTGEEEEDPDGDMKSVSVEHMLGKSWPGCKSDYLQQLGGRERQTMEFGVLRHSREVE